MGFSVRTRQKIKQCELTLGSRKPFLNDSHNVTKCLRHNDFFFKDQSNKLMNE